MKCTFFRTFLQCRLLAFKLEAVMINKINGNLNYKQKTTWKNIQELAKKASFSTGLLLIRSRGLSLAMSDVVVPYWHLLKIRVWCRKMSLLIFSLLYYLINLKYSYFSNKTFLGDIVALYKVFENIIKE